MLKALHVAAAVLLLGNVVVTGVWALVLFRHRGRQSFGPAIRAIFVTDLLFTAGGGTLLTVTGILLAVRGGYRVLETPWLMHGIGALALSTLLWLVFLLPDQGRMKRAAEGDDTELRRAFVRWNAIGWVATLLLFAGLAAMVLRI